MVIENLETSPKASRRHPSAGWEEGDTHQQVGRRGDNHISRLGRGGGEANSLELFSGVQYEVGVVISGFVSKVMLKIW